jgi:predicted kinase
VGEVIISLRGTNGAGKSTLVRAVVACYAQHADPLTAPGRRKPLGQIWTRTAGPGAGLFVPGHYEIANGGVDTLRDLEEAYDLIRRYATRGHDVLYEGKNLSDGPTRLLELKREGYDCCAVLLNVPLGTCVSSVRARGHSISEKTIERLWHKSHRDCDALEHEGVPVHAFNFREQALDCVHRLLGLK